MQSRSTTSSILIAVLVIITFPLWIGFIGMAFGLVAGVFGAVFGIIGGVFGAVFGGLGAGLGWIFAGPFHMGAIFVKVAIIAAVLILLVSALRTKRN